VPEVLLQEQEAAVLLLVQQVQPAVVVQSEQELPVPVEPQ
jgi:hypothetical protein